MKGSCDDPWVTTHAQERVTQRSGVSKQAACAFLRRAWKDGRIVPSYMGVTLHLGYDSRGKKSKKSLRRRYKDTQYRLFKNNLLVVHDGVMVTMWTLTDKSLERIRRWLNDTTPHILIP